MRSFLGNRNSIPGRRSTQTLERRLNAGDSFSKKDFKNPKPIVVSRVMSTMRITPHTTKKTLPAHMPTAGVMIILSAMFSPVIRNTQYTMKKNTE